MAVKVRQHKGKWWVFIDHHNKRKAKCIGDNKRTAQQVAEKIQAKIALGQFEIKEEQACRPFDVYFQQWLDTYVTANCKDKTYAGYKQAFRLYLLPAFGQKDIVDITREDVTSLVYTLLADKARGTAKLIVAPLRGMFNAAIALGHVAANPAQRLFRRTRKEHAEQQDKITFLQRDEVALLLQTCQSHYAVYYPIVMTLARTGLRIGECLALRWEDIDFASQFIEVRRTLSGNRLSSPKSGRSRRVDMSRQLTEMLKTLLLERKKETLRNGWGELPPWVFANSSNKPLDDSFFRRIWRKILAQTGLHYVNVHTLRHSFASLLLQSGAPIVYVKEQLGHSSIQITVDIYGHLVPGGNRDLMDRLDSLTFTSNRNPGATNTINDVPIVRESA